MISRDDLTVTRLPLDDSDWVVDGATLAISTRLDAQQAAAAEREARTVLAGMTR